MSGNVNEGEKPSVCCIYRHFWQLKQNEKQPKIYLQNLMNLN